MRAKLLIVFLAILFVFPSFCFSETEKEVTLMWDYDNPPSDLAGFEVRVNEDNSTIESCDASAVSWTKTIVLNDNNNKFEVRAKDLGGQVSEWGVCYHDPVPGDPVITVIIVK